MENLIHVALQGILISAVIVLVFFNRFKKNANNQPLPLRRHKVVAILLLTLVYVGAVYMNQWTQYGGSYDYTLKATIDEEYKSSLEIDKFLFNTIIPGLKRKAKQKGLELVVEIIPYGKNLKPHLLNEEKIVWNRAESVLRVSIQKILNNNLANDFQKIYCTLSLGIKKGIKLTHKDFKSDFYMLKFYTFDYKEDFQLKFNRMPIDRYQQISPEEDAFFELELEPSYPD